MSFKRFRVLTFDVVGTLIDFERGIIDQVHRAAGPAADGLDDEAILDVYRRSRASGDRTGRYPDDLARTWQDLVDAFSLPDIPGGEKALVNSVAHWPAFPDSVEALARLRRHFTLVAMTNARHWALDHMARTLGQPFDDRVCVDDVGLEKPDPQFFAFARGRLSTRGVALEEILHVAQSQYHDIGVARKLGYQVAWIERRHGQKGPGGTLDADYTEPHYHFTTLAELADAVDSEHS